MSDKFTLDVRQAAELAHAFERCGWTNADIKKMSSGDLLRRLLPVIRGNAEVAVVKHVIDLDADPLIPKGLKIEEHRKMGQFEWDSAKVALYLSQDQKKILFGSSLRPKVMEQDPFNANLLDYLLAHPHLIPEEWKGKAVFFWGTIYLNSDGYLPVRFLRWSGGGWGWDTHLVYCGFGLNSPAAVRIAS